jgi:hypothetical protein
MQDMLDANDSNAPGFLVGGSDDLLDMYKGITKLIDVSKPFGIIVYGAYNLSSRVI